MNWLCIDAAYAGQVTMRDVTYAGQRGKTCAEVTVTGAPEAVQAWLAAEPTWRDEADRADGIRAAMTRGLKVEVKNVKAIKVGRVEAVEIDTREVYACISHADVAWYDPEYPEYLYRPDPYRYEETCRRILRWAAQAGQAYLEALSFGEFCEAITAVAGREPVSQRQSVAVTREYSDADDFADAFFGDAPCDGVPF